MSGGPGWTEEQSLTALRMWRDRKSDRDIAAALGFSCDKVKKHRMAMRWVNPHGVPRTKPAPKLGRLDGMSDDTRFRSAVKVSTQMLLERIAEFHPQYEFKARRAA